MQSSNTDKASKTPPRRLRGAAFVALATAFALLVSTLWTAEGLANSASSSAARLVSLSQAVAHSAAKKKAKKKTKKNKKKKAKTVCYKTKKVHGKTVRVFKTVKVYKRVKRGGRFVTVVSKKRVAVTRPCKKSSANSLGVPIKITIDPAHSYATLDFYSFTRQTPISGSVSGYIPGSFVQGQANTVNITHGHIAVAQAPVFIDDVCNGQVTAAIQTGKQTYADIDPSKASTTSISAAGSIQGSLSLILHANIELRHGDLGCNSPYLTTGYTSLPVSMRVFGKLSGFNTTLDTPDTILDNLGVCISPGPETQQCNGFEIPLPLGLATHVVGSVSIG
jgi:hypothetical protein